MKVYMDSEFTGLRQGTTLISIGLVAESGETFYAEFNDYDESQVDGWIEENVISHLMFPNERAAHHVEHSCVTMKASKEVIADSLRAWLEVFNTNILIWSDCYAYDWVLFCELFGGAFGVPECVYYIPMDLSTALASKGIDPDISRQEFSGRTGGIQHNALEDAQCIKACRERLYSEE